VTETELVARTLLAREQAILVREEAADRRGRALDQRERAVEHREQIMMAANRRLVHGDAELRDANERLVVAAIDAQTTTEIAQQAAALMSTKAEHDFLTGLPNRALLADRLAQSIEMALRHGKKVALMFLDLDNFKEINDSLGHAMGDALLQSVANRLQACVRGSDTVSRYGGDEFVVLLAEVTMTHDAVIVADKLIKAMVEPHLVDSHQIHVTVSIGIALCPDDSDGADSLLAQADAAMYSAKRGGRNTQRRFTPDMRLAPVAR
jgi:diguanylate cyclase (GGDEF)-like protein